MKIQKFNESVSENELKKTILSLDKDDLIKKLSDYLYWKDDDIDGKVYDYEFRNDELPLH